MKKEILKYLLTAGLTALFASGVLGQTTPQSDRVRTELERTDEIIDRAKETVVSSNALVAAVTLKQATELQRGAKEWFGKRRLLMAYKQTLEAREQAKKALVLCRLTEQGETVVLRKLERAGELLEQAKESIPSGSVERLRALYELARDNLNRAWEFHRSQRYRPALKLANQVIKAAREILNASNRDIRKHADFERRYEGVGETINKVREKVTECGSEAASGLLEQAIKAYQLSRELASQDKLDAALQSLQKARQMAVEASKNCEGLGSLNRRYDRLKNETDHLNEAISRNNETAQKMLNQVYDQLELARKYIDQNQTEAAAAALKAAHLSLNQLKRHLGSGGM